MVESPWENDAPFFVGPPESLQVLADWLNDYERAVVCRTTEGYSIDLRELSKVLAVGTERLGCLNPTDNQKCRDLIGELQKDVAVLLARGLDGATDPTIEEQQANARLERNLRRATPHFRWLGVRVRDKLQALTIGVERSQEELDTAPDATPRRKPKGHPKADYATTQAEAKIAADWNQARETGTRKIDFVKDRGLKLKDFDKILSRVRKRKSRADK